MATITSLLEGHQLIAGLCIGFVFGMLLHKGGITKFDVVVNQFRLRDFTVLKVMLTAILVGGVGIYALKAGGAVQLHLKPTVFGPILIGGAISGIGMALLGYCPAAGVGSVAGGSVHGLVGVAGMLVGAGAYAEAYPYFKEWKLLEWLGKGEMTFPELLGINTWLLWILVGGGTVFLFLLLEIVAPAKRQ
ncbi:MAG: YeeE/YedE family protein [Planctomycetota bacterium]|nr:MAG: YeeE/YedE family protein [Planctomycetota bacterium]